MNSLDLVREFTSPSYGLLLELTCFDPIMSNVENYGTNKDKDMSTVKTFPVLFSVPTEELPKSEAEPDHTCSHLPIGRLET